jgi:hypothetical protein
MYPSKRQKMTYERTNLPQNSKGLKKAILKDQIIFSLLTKTLFVLSIIKTIVSQQESACATQGKSPRIQLKGISNDPAIINDQNSFTKLANCPPNNADFRFTAYLYITNQGFTYPGSASFFRMGSSNQYSSYFAHTRRKNFGFL